MFVPQTKSDRLWQLRKAFKVPGSVPITNQLLQLGCSARAHYAKHLEKERKEKEEAQKQLTVYRENKYYKWKLVQKRQLSREKKDLRCEEKEWESKERAQQYSMEVEDANLKDENAKLQVALKKNDFKAVSVPQAMIEAAQKKINTANIGMQQAREQRRSIS